MIRVVAFFLLCLPGLAWAQSFPALFDVTGVASDDVLNVRARPGAGSDIIGSFDHLRGNIEVLYTTADGHWGRVNSGEESGWTAMRFLVRQPGQDDATVPKPLFCGGTEPFWNALIGTEKHLRFDVMDGPNRRLTELSTVNAVGRSDKYASFWAGQDTSIVTVVTRTACNDGMSGRAFGFAADFVLLPAPGSGQGPGQLFSGCCSLSQN